MIGAQRGRTFAEALRPLALANPDAGEFTVARFDAFLQKAFRVNGSPFDFNTLQQSIVYLNKTVDPKLIVRPSYIRGIWIHQAWFFENKKYHRIHVNPTEVMMLHLRGLTLDSGEDEMTLPEGSQGANHFIDGSRMQENMETMFQKHDFKFVSFEF